MRKNKQKIICVDCKLNVDEPETRNRTGKMICKKCKHILDQRTQDILAVKKLVMDKEKSNEKIEYFSNQLINMLREEQDKLQVRATINEFSETEWVETIDYFDNCDAYTGLPLKYAVKSLIIPSEQHGDHIKENIVPTNIDTEQSKSDKTIFEWYYKQPFYDAYRMNKILQWMGKYRQLLYVPKEQRQLVGNPIQCNSLQKFSVMLPNGHKKAIYYTNRNSKGNFIQLINTAVLDQWQDYCEKRWIWTKPFDPFKLNYEDKVKGLLERLGTFILLGDFKTSNILTSERIYEICKNEVPFSCTASTVQDSVYGIFFYGEAYTTQTKDNLKITNNEILLGFIDSDGSPVKIHKARLNKIKQKMNESYQRKVEAIYTQAEKKISYLHKMTNGDYPEIPSYIKQEELKAWLKKPFRNVHGENLYEIRHKTIVEKKGWIDKTQPYKYTICVVNTDNEFWHNNKKFKIDASIMQYGFEEVVHTRKFNMRLKISLDKMFVQDSKGELINGIWINEDTFEIKGQRYKIDCYTDCFADCTVEARVAEVDKIYNMDKINVYEQAGQIFYFDMSINKIQNEFITLIN